MYMFVMCTLYTEYFIVKHSVIKYWSPVLVSAWFILGYVVCRLSNGLCLYVHTYGWMGWMYGCIHLYVPFKQRNLQLVTFVTHFKIVLIDWLFY